MQTCSINTELDQNAIQLALDDKKNYVVLDLRPKQEFTMKHVKGSVNVPLFQKFEMLVAPFVKNKKVLLILNQEDLKEAGQRLKDIDSNGVVGHLKGGINGWKGQFTQAVNIKADEFAKTKNQSDVSICDVRFPKEVQCGFIKGAKNINIMDMPNLQEIPLDKNQVHYLYCKTGMRSHIACSYLRGLDYKVVSIEGGYEGLSQTNLQKENVN